MHTENPKVEEKKAGTPMKNRKMLNIALLATSSGIALVLVLFLGALAFQKASENRILHHVTVASVDVGGMTKEEASKKLQETFDMMIDSGLQVELFSETKSLDLAPTGATDPDLVYPLLDFDVNGRVEEAYAIGRSGNTALDFMMPLYFALIGKKDVGSNVTLAETKLTESIKSAYPEAESPGTPTDFAIKKVNGVYDVSVTPAVIGSTIDISSAFKALKEDAQDLRLSPLKLQLVERSALVSETEAENLIDNVESALSAAPYTLTFTNEDKKKLTWTVSEADLMNWLEPGTDENGKAELTVNTSDMGTLLSDVHAKIDIAPHDAIFETDGERVTKFEPSREGIKADDDALVASLVAAFQGGAKEIAISAERSLPDITTESSNDYGIKELLGTGESTYGGSPSNRRANIKHGADKLNGLLIAPGETLSLIEKLQPFTVEDGYLPELVIKGDEIKPEIGGGLCQIGTTTFRSAMNSGLDIVERRNHSLVVSYYNDLSNGQPGTDATIYDPSPDLKIKNDTPGYVLLITTNDTANSHLYFSFWGTSDGRVGSYTPPKVLSWTGYGDPIIKETDTLAPGQKTCQAAHPGATTTFTYNITNPDGTVTSKEFPSTYRALPQICLVGKAAPTDTGGGTGTDEAIPVE